MTNRSRSLRLPAVPHRLRPAPVRRRQAAAVLRQVRRAAARGRRREGRQLRRLGAECPQHQRRRRLQPLGWPPPPDEAARRPAACGNCSFPGSTPGEKYKFRVRGAARRSDRQERSVRLRGRAAAVYGVDRHRPVAVPVERSGVDGPPGEHQPARAADLDLRSPPRQLEARRRPASRLAELSRAGPSARRLLPGDGLHAPRADADQRASLLGLLGLSNGRLLRRHQPLWHAGRFRVLRRLLPPARHRRDPRLGAGPLPQGRPRPAAVRRHRAATSTKIPARASIPTGAR